MKSMRRVLALLLTFSMVVSLLGTAVFAADEPEYVCGKEAHKHVEACYEQNDVDEDDYYAADSLAESSLVCGKEEHTHDDTCVEQEEIEEELVPLAEPEDTTVVYGEDNILYLTDAELTEGIELDGGWTIIVSGENSINGGDGNAIIATGGLTIKGSGTLALTGANGIKADSVVLEDIDVDFDGTSCGIQAYNAEGTASVTLKEVSGKIVGDYAGIYVCSDKDASKAFVDIDDCDLEVVSEATSWNNRARKSGITVYANAAEQVEGSITISDSKVEAEGFDAGMAINNFNSVATNSASSRITITDSIVTATGRDSHWAGIFASTTGMHEDGDSIITITNSSVYAVSPSTGILTSSQLGESKIILDNSILGAEGKTALSMIEGTCQAQAAELKNGSTYVQMTPDAVMKGEIVNFDGKVIIATAGDGLSYDEDDNYYIIPQGSAVTESFTDGEAKEYTFNDGEGGVGGFDYEKEEIWGYDVPEETFKWAEGDIVIYTPEELIEFATYTQDGTLGNCDGRTVKLGNDIDMSGYDWYYRNTAGEIITDHRIPQFIGTFDGQGYAIKNMSYVDEYADATELAKLAFILEGKSFLKDLTIDGITVETEAPAYFAGLVKDYAWSGSSNGTVEGCCVKNIEIDAKSDLTFGGMFYRLVGGKAINDCHVENMTVNVDGALVGDNGGRNGGFVATGGEPMTMTDCSVTDLEVNAGSTGGYLGGFVGGGSVSGNYINCDVDGFELNAEAKFSAVGGFVGYTAGSAWGSNSTYENCDVSGLDIETTDKISVGAGGFIGNVYGQDNHRFVNCTTEGTISGNAYAGGFAGWLYGRSKCTAEFTDCSAAVNIVDNDYLGGGFVGNYTPSGSNVCNTTYTNCTASGDVFAKEPVGSFLDADDATVDGIIGGTYSYDPENVDAETGETNNVAPGYRALDNGDGTWTVFPDNGKEVVKVAFHRWNDELNGYENWRTVEVFKDVDFLEADYDNELNYSHPDYRFAKGIGELDEEADDATVRTFQYWTDAPGGTKLVLDNEIEVLADMDVYAAYPEFVCEIVETGVKYYTLTAAVADANASEGADTIRMLKSIDFDSDKALTVTGDITIIGEGLTISRGDYTGTLFTVPAGSSLTLDGGITFDGSNNWIFEKDLYENDLYNRIDNPITAYAYSAEGGTCGTAAAFVVNGAMTVKDATIENFFSTKDSNAGDAAIFKVNANATLTTDGALIDHCATYGANTVAHLAKDAKWYIQGDTVISNNFGGRNGGICRNDSGQIYMSDGIIKDTAGKNVNGTVFMMYGTGSAFYMTGGTICGNSSTFGANNGRCAAVYLHANSYMKMTGGTICHNVGGTRGGIDSYKSSSVLDINRVDQTFVDGVYPNENGKDAYTASNHPLVVDNVSLLGSTQNDVGHSFNFDTWWVTGGIYTQDVDEFCARGYVCIPYDDSERTDDYIVVPAYRVKHYSVETVETTNAETGEVTSEIVTTLEKQYFHMLDRDKFWNEMDERAEYWVLEDAEKGVIDTWYTEKELQNVYDFEGTKLESDLNLYGEYPSGYTVAYDYNGGLDGEETKSSVSVDKDSVYNPSKSGVPAPTQEGYILAGWKYAKDPAADSESKEDTGKWYMGETLTTTTRFIAQWVKAPEEPVKEDPIPIHLGTKTDELIDRNTNRYTVNIDVPGAAGITGHDEVIMMVDGSYSLDQEWPKMKETIIEIAETVLNGSGTTQLTLMAFGMGDNEVIVHAKDAAEVAAALGELPGNLLYGRSSTNCEAGFTGVANYIRNHDNTLNNVDVIYISDGRVNTDETPRAFAQNWKAWATRFGSLTVAQAAFEGSVAYGENLPAAFTTVFGDRFAGASRDEMLTRGFGGEVTNEEFYAYADQIWMDVYAYSGLSIGVEYPVSVAERAFVKYDKEHGTYVQDTFYYTTYDSSHVKYPNGTTRAQAAADALAAMDEVKNLFVVDYDSKSEWMDTGITNEKATFILSSGIAGLLTALDGALVEMSKAPINDPVITDYMSKWVNLDASTLKVIDNNTGAVLWSAKDGWLTANQPTAKNPPVVVEKVDPADYAAGGDDVIGNTSGDIYKLTWYLKDGALLRSDDFRLSYEVTVDTKEEGFVYEIDYPANGNTFIEYKDDEGNKKGNDIEVPNVDAIPVVASLNIHKVNEAGTALAGAEFEVRDAETQLVVARGTTDKNGNLTLELEAGAHLLVETKAPAGYMVAAKAVELTVNEDLTINVKNSDTATYEGGVLEFVNLPPHSAVVLTIDMSGTMYRYKMGGKRYVDVAKAKALEFVEDYAASAVNGSKRMLAVTGFDTDAKLVQKWIDVSTASGLATAKKAINAMKVADNGSTSSNQVCTNFDGGVILTRNLLKQSTVEDIDRRFAIILSDGAPTVTVNSDTNTVGTIESSFWGNQLDMNGTKYQNKRCGGGWTHPGEVDRTLKYLEGLDALTYDYNVNGEKGSGIFIVGVGGDMSVKLFYDAVYGTKNGTRTTDVKKKPGAFNYVEALQGIKQEDIMKMTTGQWLENLADRVDGTYVSAAEATALEKQFQLILDASVKTD